MVRVLTTTEAAHLAHVGVTTIKRWVDQGLLPSIRTAGGHRRIHPADLERLVRRPATVEVTSTPETDRWVDLLLTGDRYRIDAQLLSERGRLGAWHLVADALGLALGGLGARWQAGRVTVAEEHRASDALERALSRIHDALPVSHGARACLLAVVPGDDHVLGLRLAELCLRERGWFPLWLGRLVPGAEVERLVIEGRVDMVAYSASGGSSDPQPLAELAEALAAVCAPRGVSLVLGGEGAWPQSPREAARVRSFSEFHQLLGGRSKERT